jgi:uncharacterized damage-inducible protein DinB
MTADTTAATFITTDAFREHWQGHRRLTRRLIEAFPEDRLFTFSIGGMRPFGGLVLELIAIVADGMDGCGTGVWLDETETNRREAARQVTTKRELLRLWDEATLEIETRWPQIAPARFSEVDKAFGLYEGTITSSLLYFMDNEVHHRGQGYAYLRSLGIEPPAFYDRS